MTARILIGDVRDRLAELPDESVHCVVTSPPYYGLRDYGVPGQIGLEPTLADYLATMVAVFRDVRRVLRDDGTCWVNVGDSYNSGAQYNGNRNKDSSTSVTRPGQYSERVTKWPGHRALEEGLKVKDLMMVPARLALALQDDGWYLRSDIIWAKPNPMPESVTDRPTSSHEHIFLLTKSRRYYYDADAVRLPASSSTVARLSQDLDAQQGSNRANGGAKTTGAMKAVARLDKQRGHGRRHDGFNDRWDAMSKDEQQETGANLRNVWTVATRPFKEAHFATFPPEIPRRCILAGCPKGGVVLDLFGGSGTTGVEAERLERDSILIELNPEYAAMAERRIRGDAPMFADVSVEPAHAHATLDMEVA